MDFWAAQARVFGIIWTYYRDFWAPQAKEFEIIGTYYRDLSRFCPENYRGDGHDLMVC